MFQKIKVPQMEKAKKLICKILSKPLITISLILFLLLLVFFNDVFFRNKTLKSSATIPQALYNGPYDLKGYQVKYISYTDNTPGASEEPFLQFKKNALSKGNFPLWNPHLGCGTPFFASCQTNVLFPLSIILYFIPDKYAWDFYIILQIFLAGLFTFYFMRLLGYLLIPSIIAAIAYMFSGPIITWMVNINLSTDMLLPLVLFCIEKIFRDPDDRKCRILSSFVFTTLLLSGHVEHILFVAIAAFLFFIFKFSLQRAINRPKILMSTTIALIFSICLASPFIFSASEYLFKYGWIGHDTTTGLKYNEVPKNAITLLIPYFFQKVLLTTNYERAGWFGGYVGIVTTLLALIAIFKKDSRKHNIIFAFIGLFAILKCFGVWPVNLIGYLPLFNKIYFSLHFHFIFAFSMAVLAGIGVNFLIESKGTRSSILLSTLLIAAIIIGHLTYYKFNAEISRAVIYAFILLILISLGFFFIKSSKALSVILALLLVSELYYLMPKEHAPKYDAFAKVPYMEFLKSQKDRTRAYGIQWTFFPNTATGYQVDDLGGYEGNFIERFVRYVHEFISPYHLPKNGIAAMRHWLPDYNSPFLDLLNLKYIIAPNWVPDIGIGKPVYSNEVNIFERQTAFPRAFVVHRAVFEKSQEKTIQLMKENAGNLRNLAFVETENTPEFQAALSSSPEQDSSSAEITEYTPNRVKIKAQMENPGFLILSDTYYPGWKAKIDGKKTKVYPAYLMLRSVFVDKGTHEIEFYFLPFSFLLGVGIAFLTLIILIFSCRLKIFIFSRIKKSLGLIRDKIKILTNRLALNHFVSVVIILLLFVGLFFHDVIFQNKTLKSSATISQALPYGPYDLKGYQGKQIPYIDNSAGVWDEPMQEFKNNSFKNSIFPLWLPHIFCGSPFFANMLTTVLFPLSSLLYLAPEKYAWDIFIIIQILLAGIFTFYFMKILGYRFLACLCSAIAYMFSGPIITWMINVTLSTDIFLPLILAFEEKIIQKPNKKRTILLSLAFLIILLSGHVEKIFLAYLIAAFYFICRIISYDVVMRVKIFKAVVLSLLLSSLLAAILLIPGIEFLQQAWTTHDKTAGLTFDPLTNTITILIPYFFQKEIVTTNYHRIGWAGGYIGIMIALLSLVGVFKNFRNKFSLIFALIAIFVLLKSFGAWVVNWIGYLPVFNHVLFAFHCTQILALSLAILSGIGIAKLVESKSPFKDLFIPAVIIALIILGHLKYHHMDPEKIKSTVYAFALLLLALSGALIIKNKNALAIFLFLALSGELFFIMPKDRAPKYNSFAKVPYIEFLKNQRPRPRVFGISWALFPNTATGYGIDDLGGYEGLFSKRFVRFVNEFVSFGNFYKRGFGALRTSLPSYSSPYLDLLNLKYIIAPNWVNDIGAGKKVYSDEVNIFERETAFPRAFVVHRAVFDKDQDKTVASMKENSGNLRNLAFIEAESTPEFQAALSSSPEQDSSSAEITEYTPNRIKIKAQMENPGFLILSDTYYPGWKAKIDGKKTKVYPAYLMLRAVFVNKGTHEIEFYFMPFSFALGAIISILTLIILLLYSFTHGLLSPLFAKISSLIEIVRRHKIFCSYTFLALIILLALTIRIYPVIKNPETYRHGFGPFGDSAQYHVMAYNIYRGNGVSSSESNRAWGYPPLNTKRVYEPAITRGPVYPFFIATVYKLFGKEEHMNSIETWRHNWDKVRVAQCVMDALLCVVLFLMARVIYPDKFMPALLASFLYCFSFYNIYYTKALLSETLGTFILTLAMFFLTLSLRNGAPPLLSRGSSTGSALGGACAAIPPKKSFIHAFKGMAFCRRDKSWRWWAWAGALSGLTIFSRVEYLPFFPLLAAFIFIIRKKFAGVTAKNIYIFIAAMILILTPWAARNYIVFKKPILVNSGAGGFGLWVGTFDWQGFGDLPKDISESQKKEIADLRYKYNMQFLSGSVKTMETDEKFKQMAVERILNHPFKTIRLWIKNLPKLWYQNYIQIYPQKEASGLFFVFYFIFAAFGFWKSPPDKKLLLFPVCLLFGYLNLIFLPFCIEPRYSVRAMPSIIVLSAIGLWAVLSSEKLKQITQDSCAVIKRLFLRVNIAGAASKINRLLLNKRFIVYFLLSAIFILALVVRLYPVIKNPETYRGGFGPYGDTMQYHTLAFNILKGHGFSISEVNNAYGYDLSSDRPKYEPAITRSPVYPLFIAAVYKFFGSEKNMTPDNWHYNLDKVRIVQCILDALLCIVLFFIVRIIYPKSFIPPLLAALTYCFSFYNLFYVKALISESLSTFILTCSIFFYLLALKKDKWHGWVFAGLWLGLMTLARVEYLLFLVMLSAYILILNRQSLQKGIKFTTIFFLSAIIVVIPWTIRNYIVFKKPILVHIGNFGCNLYPGTFEYGAWSGRAHPDSSANEKEKIDYLASQHFPEFSSGSIKIKEIDDEMTKFALGHIKAHPLKCLTLWVKRIPRLWYFNYIQVFIEKEASGNFFIFYFIFGLIAFFYLKERKAFAWPIAFVFIFLTVLYLPLYVEPRYAVAVIPSIICLSGIGIWIFLTKLSSFPKIMLEKIFDIKSSLLNTIKALDITKKSIIVIMSLSLIYSVLRIFILSVTHDEALTYAIQSSHSFWQLFSYNISCYGCLTNHHLLNTIIVKILNSFLGSSTIALRGAALIGHFLYVIGIYKALSLFLKRLPLLIGFCFATLHPFVLDYFCSSRGYGLGLGFLAMGLFYFLKAINKDIPGERHINITVSTLMFCFATLANLTFLNVLIPALLIMLATEITSIAFVKGKENLFCRAKGFAKLLFIYLLPLIALLAGTYHNAVVKMAKGNEFDWGGSKGFWQDTVVSLLRVTLFNKDYFGINFIPWLLILIFLLLAGAVALLICIYYKKRFVNPENKYLFSVISLIVLYWISIILEHHLFNTVYATERRAIYFIPTFSIFILLFWLNLGNFCNKFKPIINCLFMALASLIIIHYVHCFNFSYLYSCRYDASTKEAINEIVKLNNGKILPQNSIRLGINWEFEPSVNFYINSNNLTWISPVDRSGPDGSFDYYYLFADTFKALEHKYQLITIKEFPNTGNYLAVKGSM
ncbi:MAG: YfhO family protein [Candidatus Omnitrophica bacterium]|nr:YfhO family protein [Candidatus Omnitrophota bacterium]